MLTHRQLFLQHQAQTSPAPLSLEIEKAEHIYLYGKNGKRYMDLISGIAVSSLGHRHPKIVEAIKKQLDQYMHLMVYGEYIQSPQTELAGLLASSLPDKLNCCYFVNSGSEATEGALKLAKRYTGRTEIIAFKNAYHGSTQGSLSVMGNEYFKNSFRPLLPDIKFIEFNNTDELSEITERTACVIVETIQGEAGVRVPENDFLKNLSLQCKKNGTLLIADEIQTGFGRTGSLFAFSQYDFIPDILTIGKAMGGGMPIGGFISSSEIMHTLTANPVLGHITTFGGHPVSCAAALASLKVLLEETLIDSVFEKEKLFRKLLVHQDIKEIRGKGLLLAIVFADKSLNFKVIEKCIENGLITDWFLFSDDSMRIAPPIIISESEIQEACATIIKSIEQAKS